MNKPSETDPRVARTRSHVLATARTMLGERNGGITFSTLSVRAEVSRRTLYTHWGTIENLFADIILPSETGFAAEFGGLDLRDRLTLFYRAFSDAVSTEIAFGVATMLWASQYDAGSARSVVSIGSAVRAIFTERVAPLTEDQYHLLISPVLLVRMSQKTVPESLIASLVELGTQQLESAELTPQ